MVAGFRQRDFVKKGRQGAICHRIPCQRSVLNDNPSMTIPPFLGDNPSGSMWDDLGKGAPTIMSLARLCGEALGRPPSHPESLSDEACCLLYLGRERGAFEVKATDNAFDAIDRFLTVHVEIREDELLPMKIRSDAAATSRLFAGFCELCAGGWVMHHIYRDFSLTPAGFEHAQAIPRERIELLLEHIAGERAESL